MEAEIREDRHCNSASFEDGGKGHKPRNVGILLKLEMERKQILTKGLQKEYMPIYILILPHQN